jgi:leader peptidase (prepilin peptidase)/N-methyltransferase
MSPATASYGLWHLTSFALGACLGSFLNVAILRIPEGESVVSPPSRCPVCRTPLSWRDNVPLLSWLVLRGRCRTCGAPISPMYPLVEATMGMVAWLLWARFVSGPADLDLRHVAAWVTYTTFAWLVLLAAYTDVRTRIIPELASLWAVPVGLVAAVVLQQLGYDGWLALGWRQAVLGAAVGGGFLGIVSTVWYRVSGSEGVAWGDVRLMAMIGAFVGPIPGAWIVLLLSSFVGAFLGIAKVVASGRSGYLPFGPSLAVAALAYVLYGDVLVERLFPGMAGFL